jgi:hypothetical protein
MKKNRPQISKAHFSKAFNYLSFVGLLSFTLLSCETPENGNWDAPTTTQPAFNEGFSEDARSAGNSLFGNVDNPSRMPSGREITETMQPGGDCTSCAASPVAPERSGLRGDPRYSYSLKNYPRPSHGCTSYNEVSASEARRLLASQNLDVRAASGSGAVTDRELRSVGAAIKRVQELNGGPLSTGMGPSQNGGPYPFVFKDENGSNQRVNQINIGRNTSRGHTHYGNSVAQHVHEWAHLIGNNGGYPAYRRAMGGAGYCLVSNYADNNANEQFAEVFTAFVTEPETLLNNSRTPEACRRAFNFFKNEFFNRGRNVENCIPHPLRN